MNILYVINKSKGYEAKHERTVALAKLVTMKLSDDNEGKSTHSDVLCYDGSTNFSLRLFVKSLRQLNETLRRNNPDIVHIYGSWSIFVCLSFIITHRKRIITIYSPNGELYHFSRRMKNFWREYFPKWITYQYWIIKHSKYFITRDINEKQILHRYNRKAYKAVIPIKEDETTIRDTLLTIYHKILDANVYSFMTEDEKRAIRILTRIGVDKIANTIVSNPSQHYSGWTLSPEDKHKIYSLGDEELRKIYLLAEKLNILDIVNRGLKSLNLDEFSHCHQYRDITIESQDSIFSKKIKYDDTVIRQLAQFYVSLKYNDYDEILFAENMRKKKRYGFIRALESILEESFMLEEGYMPLPKQNGYYAKRIRSRIIKAIERVNLKC